MAAFDFGALLSGATQGLGSFRRGQLKGEDVHREREEAERVQLFNEFAKRQQLQQQAAATEGLNEYRQGQVDIKDRVAALAQKVAEQGSYKDQQTVGPGGTVTRGQDMNYQTAAERNAALLEAARIRAEASGEAARIRASAQGQGQGPRPRPVPTGVTSAYLTNQRQLRTIDDAIAQVSANPGAVGLKAAVPGTILNRVKSRTGAGGVNARAGVADVGSLEIRDRSGAAVTASEFPRLKPFIPAITDDAATVQKKLRRMRQIIEEENEAMAGFYTPDQGYMGLPSPTGAPAAPADDLDDLDGFINRRRGGRKP